MSENPLILFRDWLLNVPKVFSDQLASEILCSFYIWQKESNIFRSKYDLRDELNTELGTLTTMLLTFIDDVVATSDHNLSLKYACLNVHSISSFVFTGFELEIDTDILRDFEIQNLLGDELTLANFFESRIQDGTDVNLSKLKLQTKKSWDSFSQERFNVKTILNYLIQE